MRWLRRLERPQHGEVPALQRRGIGGRVVAEPGEQAAQLHAPRRVARPGGSALDRVQEGVRHGRRGRVFDDVVEHRLGVQHPALRVGDQARRVGPAALGLGERVQVRPEQAGRRGERQQLLPPGRGNNRRQPCQPAPELPPQVQDRGAGLHRHAERRARVHQPLEEPLRVAGQGRLQLPAGPHVVLGPRRRFVQVGHELRQAVQVRRARGVELAPGHGAHRRSQRAADRQHRVLRQLRRAFPGPQAAGPRQHAALEVRSIAAPPELRDGPPGEYCLRRAQVDHPAGGPGPRLAAEAPEPPRGGGEEPRLPPQREQHRPERGPRQLGRGPPVKQPLLRQRRRQRPVVPGQRPERAAEEVPEARRRSAGSSSSSCPALPAVPLGAPRQRPLQRFPRRTQAARERPPRAWPRLGRAVVGLAGRGAGRGGGGGPRQRGGLDLPVVGAPWRAVRRPSGLDDGPDFRLRPGALPGGAAGSHVGNDRHARTDRNERTNERTPCGGR